MARPKIRRNQQGPNQMTTASSEDEALRAAAEAAEMQRAAEDAEVAEVDESEAEEPSEAVPTRSTYQSDEAREAAVVVEAPVEPPKPAAVSGAATNEDGVVVKVAKPLSAPQDMNKMVKARPLRTEKRVRIGNEWYNFQQGKECLVPRHVYTLLRQKGLFA